MSAYFRQAPLAFLLALELRTAATTTRTLLCVPCNVRSNMMIYQSSTGTWVPSQSFSGFLHSSRMADDAAGTARLFSAAQGNIQEILDVLKWRPPPSETG